MHDYEPYKQRVETKQKRELKELLHEKLIKEGKGPSVCAHELGVPRPVVVYYRSKYGLKQYE